MGKRTSILFCMAVFLTLAWRASAAEVIDRIVATVNGHIILLSDWEDSLRYEAFSGGRPLDRIAGGGMGAARTIDGIL